MSCHLHHLPQLTDEETEAEGWEVIGSFGKTRILTLV